MYLLKHYLKILHKAGWSLCFIRRVTYNNYMWAVSASKDNKTMGDRLEL